ncbi:MAG: phospholipid/cholesterol/gamma-HCH transport system substrate-binding protein [Mycobacterium sp.]|jgi:virulence factor Mce-like protein|nr:phospholipid/cholesterol/gamma-HCH transport system substrate-binding protein [Mycobacterium sp.]
MSASNGVRLGVMGAFLALVVSGCSFSGLNSLPLPGAVGRGSDATIYHVEIANAGTLEANSPVMIDDVVVGSVVRMTFSNWHADTEISLRPDVIVPANAVASVGQTSLLGSMHVSLDPPLGQPPSGRLDPGATIPLNQSSVAPSTEQTLSSLSAVVNGGGLGQIGDVIHSLNDAFTGHEGQIRDALTRLDTFVATLDGQRNNIIDTIAAVNRLSTSFADQRDVITEALRKVPPALDVLIRERPRITTALEKLGTLSDTTNRLVNDSQADLVQNLTNLEPTLRALADIGPGLDKAIAYAPAFPYGQDIIDRGVRGDYMNLFITLDLTVPRLKRTLFLGTRWGQSDAKLIPAPGDPSYLNYSYDPLGAPLTALPDAPPGAEGAPDNASLGPDAAAAPPVAQAVLPVNPPPLTTEVTPARPGAPAEIFAGPYGSTPPASEAGPTTGGH